MKYLICLSLLVSGGMLAGAWDWAHTIGGSQLERGWDVACDLESNIFVAGEFSDTLQINGQSYPALGLIDSFVAKYSPEGELIWARTFGSPDEDCALGVDADAAGNCYVAGYFADIFHCQGQSRISNGLWDGYVLKLDPQGNLVWLQSFGGAWNDMGHGLAVNASGQVYVAGWFAGSIKFSPSATITSAGGSDVYVAAWDSAGNFRWAKRAGSAGVDYGYKVACDNSGAAYVTGVAPVGAEFGPFTLPTPGMYAAKYAADGTELWLAPSDNAMVISISVQPDAGPGQKGMVCGRVVGAGSIGPYPFNSIDGTDDFYWARLDAETGLWDYAGFHGGALSDKGRDCDYEAYPAFVGTFEGDAEFYAQSYNSNGESDLIMGWGPAANPQLTVTGGANSEVPFAVKILPNGKLAVSGWHFGLCQIGGHVIDSGDVSNQNAFVACFDPATPVSDPAASAQALLCSPNPFREGVSVYGCKSGETVRVYNLKGQLVRSLEVDPAGNCRWDGLTLQGQSAGSGVYYLKSGTAVGKVLRLK